MKFINTIFFTWWFWAITGLVFLICEIVAPVFIFLGIAVGAFTIALIFLIAGTGMLISSVFVLLLIFAIASLIAILILRYIFGYKANQVKTFDHDINE